MTTLPQSALDAFTTLEEFRDYFAGIPEEKWCVIEIENDSGQRCAMGHLVCVGASEAFNTFRDLLGNSVSVTSINNGDNPRFPQPTPRARILAAIDEAIKRRDLKTL